MSAFLLRLWLQVDLVINAREDHQVVHKHRYLWIRDTYFQAKCVSWYWVSYGDYFATGTKVALYLSGGPSKMETEIKALKGLMPGIGNVWAYNATSISLK